MPKFLWGEGVWEMVDAWEVTFPYLRLCVDVLTASVNARVLVCCRVGRLECW